MARRTALAAAGALSAAAIAAAVAVGANFGLFGLTRDGAGPGRFNVVDAARTSSTTSGPPASTVVPVPGGRPVAHDGGVPEDD